MRTNIVVNYVKKNVIKNLIKIIVNRCHQQVYSSVGVVNSVSKNIIINYISKSIVKSVSEFVVNYVVKSVEVRSVAWSMRAGVVVG